MVGECVQNEEEAALTGALVQASGAVCPVLRAVDLTVTIGGQSDVEGVSLSLVKREILAVVGESGCGKTITALSILGLQPNDARIANGRIEFDGEDLVAMG